MGKTELSRIKAIDRQLAKAKKRYRKVSHVYAQVAAERKSIDALITALHSERDALSQGQLMFGVRIPEKV